MGSAVATLGRPRARNRASALACTIARRVARRLLCLRGMKLMRMFVLSLSFSAFGCAAVTADTSKTSSPTTAMMVEVPNPPPDPKTEQKTECPGTGYIWVAGYWDYIGGHHIWRDGRWVQGKPGYE